MKRWSVPFVIVGLVGATLAGLGALYAQSRSATNRVALSSEPKGVSVVAVEVTTYRPSRRYVGTLQPWLSARLGPQTLSAYVDEVRVRPGDVVRKGDLLASLDCRRAAVASRTVAMQTRALEARQKALSSEAARVQKLLDGGYVSENEVEQKQAQSAAEQAQLLALRSQLSSKSLEADDCALRAPFDGEVSERNADPGTYARPGAPIVTILDRSTARLAIDVPETDHDAVAPGTAVRVRLLAGDTTLTGKISRRSPGADPGTRTIHAEIDLPDPDHRLPVGTSAEVTVEVGEPAPALAIPVNGARVRGRRAALFVLDGDTAHSREAEVIGESAGRLYLRPSLPPDTRVVTEGRSLLADGDKVAARVLAARPPQPAVSASASASTSASARPRPPTPPPPASFPRSRPRPTPPPDGGAAP